MTVSDGLRRQLDVCNGHGLEPTCGAETCDAVLDCQAGTPLDEDDGVSCTVDSCDPVTGVANVATDSLCDDSGRLHGSETCDAVLDCQAGTPLVRMTDDGQLSPARDDSCDPVSRRGASTLPNDG